MRKFTDYKILTFDCYGTLIDWESGIWDAGQPLLKDNNTNNITREDFLSTFAAAEAFQEAATPTMIYPDLLSEVHR